MTHRSFASELAEGLRRRGDDDMLLRSTDDVCVNGRDRTLPKFSHGDNARERDRWEKFVSDEAREEPEALSMTRTTFMAIAVIAISVSATTNVFAQRAILVHIKPVEKVGGFVDETTKRRTDSRADLIKVLIDNRGIKLTDDEAEADVVLDVVSSASEDSDEINTQSRPRLLGGGSSSTTSVRQQLVVRVTLTAGEYSSEIRGVTNSISWRAAAREASDQIRKWIQMNRKELIARKP